MDAADGHSRPVLNDSEATIAVVPAMCTMAWAAICSNSSRGDPFIIMEERGENSGEKYPVMSSTVAGEPVCLERGFPDAAVTTVVAGSGQDVRTGQQDKDLTKIRIRV